MPTKQRKQPTLKQMNFNDIDYPGVYVDTITGDIFRVAPDGVGEGRSPFITTLSKHWVARLSEDWKLTRSKAISLAADFDLYVSDDNEYSA